MFNWLLRPFRQRDKKERPQAVTQARRNNTSTGRSNTSPDPLDINNPLSPFHPLNAASYSSISTHHGSDSGATHHSSHDSGGSCDSGGSSSGGCSGD